MTEFLTFEDRTIAVTRRAGGGPGLFWLSGFRSDMMGSKALVVDALGAARGLAVTRFDYSGHGASGGDFNDGTLSRWLAETAAVFSTTIGPQIIIGSSMGGYLALLLNRALRQSGAATAAGLVLIAPAVDMTELMVAKMPPEMRARLAEQGFVDRPSQYSPEPYRYTQALIDDGARHILFGAPIETGCPVAILQGGTDPDVPKAHALKLLAHLVSDPVTLTLVPDGDHRLSRPEDLQLLTRVIEQMVEGVARA